MPRRNTILSHPDRYEGHLYQKALKAFEDGWRAETWEYKNVGSDAEHIDYLLRDPYGRLVSGSLRMFRLLETMEDVEISRIKGGS